MTVSYGVREEEETWYNCWGVTINSKYKPHLNQTKFTYFSKKQKTQVEIKFSAFKKLSIGLVVRFATITIGFEIPSHTLYT